ncbi:MAG: Fe-S cluster assembly protein SufD [Caldilineae bacterium]|nr:MAG: Fe-S cluster assembly protein SufD [Caldilineae bacterium]
MTVQTATPQTIAASAAQAISEQFDEPQWLRQARLNAWETFQEIPWPTYKEETWRRTRLTGFKLEDYQLSTARLPRLSSRAELPAELVAELEQIDSGGALIFDQGSLIYAELDKDLAERGVVFTDIRTALEQEAELVRTHFSALIPASENKFAALHYALWLNGTFLYVPKRVVVEKPLQVIIKQGAGQASFHHSLIIGDIDSEVVIVEDFFGSKDGMSDSVAEVYPKAASRVHYLRLQNLDESAWNFATMRASAYRDALYRQLQASWGSHLSKVWIDLDMEEPGSHGELLGLYFPQHRQHIDHHTNQKHKREHCSSDLLFKGALDEHTRSVYQGIIKVWPGAQKTDAYQKNDNLILSDGARADSIPGLEIEADDVRCTHGATSAKVQDDYLFYLMARGLSRKTAKRMIVQGFFEEVLNRVPVPGVRAKLEAEIARRVGLE